MVNGGTFTCKQCGTCCHKFFFVETEVGWERIIDFVKKKYNGILKIEYYHGKPTYHKIKSIKDIPWKELDICKCPFLKRLRDLKGRFTSKFLCEIHDFKPETCMVFPKDKKHAKSFCDCQGFD